MLIRQFDALPTELRSGHKVHFGGTRTHDSRGDVVQSGSQSCFVKVQRSCLLRKPLLSTAMPSTVGTRRRFSWRFIDAHAASGRPEARYLRVLIVRMYSQQAVELCVVTDRRGNSSDVSHGKDVVRTSSRSVKKRRWESNPLRPSCSRMPSRLAPASLEV